MVKRHKVYFGLLLLAVLGGGLLWLLQEESGDSTVSDEFCKAKTRRIAEGLREYREVNKAFPPAFTTAKDGTRLHSWRVLLLPYIGYDDLYKSIDLSVAWDHPRNRHAHDRCPELFKCFQADERAFTSHVAVTGAGTIWGMREVSDLDGLLAYKCVSIVVVDNSLINWMEPRDIEVSYTSWKEDLGRVFRGSPVRVIRGFTDPQVDDWPADEILQDRKYIFVEPRHEPSSNEEVTRQFPHQPLRLWHASVQTPDSQI